MIASQKTTTKTKRPAKRRRKSLTIHADDYILEIFQRSLDCEADGISHEISAGNFDAAIEMATGLIKMMEIIRDAKYPLEIRR